MQSGNDRIDAQASSIVSELRWNALLGEWVATATHRNTRTFLPPAEFCPLCPPEPALETAAHFVVAPALGACEVVVYTSRHDATLALAQGIQCSAGCSKHTIRRKLPASRGY